MAEFQTTARRLAQDIAEALNLPDQHGDERQSLSWRRGASLCPCVIHYPVGGIVPTEWGETHLVLEDGARIGFVKHQGCWKLEVTGRWTQDHVTALASIITWFAYWIPWAHSRPAGGGHRGRGRD